MKFMRKAFIPLLVLCFILSACKGKDNPEPTAASESESETETTETSFLNDYEAALNEVGFDRENPDAAGSNKAIAICNEEEGMMVGIDFFEQDGGALVNFDFKAE